ncbi:unnamed protein product [Rotaria sordida]|uniref:Uncharacterized protein n=1 Tax=Rotaria sordida TaxID=392033 RepID=A0A814UTL4_9BILA|nr:unnamed protein product [Rotaria sordida]CAF1179963.1 unnamed protein product [Rotaria sordida]CAF1180657.1 unnamed protein product [Rotaria sordida]
MKEVLEKQLLLNALSNYLVYNSLDEAIDRKLQDIIPACLEQRKDYSNRWNNTIQEFRRLISRIIKSNKFTIRDTHSLGEVEQLIRKFSKPINEMVTLIQENLQLVEQHFKKNNKKQKKNAGAQNNDVIVDLEKLLINYKHEIHILQQEMIIKPITIFTYSSNFTDVFKSEEVFCVVDSLYPIINQ